MFSAGRRRICYNLRALLNPKDFMNVVSVRRSRWTVLSLVIATGALLFSFVRLFFGFDSIDESFQIALPYRVFLGTRPYIDEWHPSQTFALLTRPFFEVYCRICRKQ